MTNMALPKIGITMGDPTGIGPEIIVKALSKEDLFRICRPIIFGDPAVLLQAIQREALPIQIVGTDKVPEEGYEPGKIFLMASSQLEIRTLVPGKPDRMCGQAMVKAVEKAVGWIEKGHLNALTTCPINKQAIHEAGYAFSGHTELLGHLAGVKKVAMMFIGSRWRIVFVTTHLAIQEVPKHITHDRILNILQLTRDGLKRYFGVDQPRIAILGLNPHCGEEGLLGKEEREVILPAIEEATRFDLDVEGPFPADSFFQLSKPHPFDAVVAMYHDQGLIPIKMLDFQESVNFTLGLPFVRTSVGHGTAYDIVGKSQADPTNLIHAIVTAAHLSTLQREI